MKNLIIAALVIVCLLLVGCGGDVPYETFKVPATTSVPTTIPESDMISIGVNKAKYYADKSSFSDEISLLHGENSLSVSNGGDESVRVLLYFSSPIALASAADCRLLFDGRGISTEVGAGKAIALDITSDGGHLGAVTFEIGQIAVSYVCDGDALVLAVSDESFAKTLSVTRNIRLEELSVTRPCYIVLESTTLSVSGDISVDFGTSGGFSIVTSEGAAVDCGEFYADTPKSDIVLPTSLVESVSPLSYHIRALSLNAVPLENECIEITSDAALARLLDDDLLPTLCSGDRLKLVDGCRIVGNYTIDMPISIEICRGAYVEVPISVITNERTTISVTAEEGSYAGRSPILISAPHADVIWDDCRMNIAQAAELWNFGTLNGRNHADGLLGGSADPIKSIRMDSDDNLISSDIIFERTEGSYIFSATFDRVADPDALRAALLAIDSDGSVKINKRCDLLDPLGVTITADDGAGGVVRYLLTLNYIPTKLPVIVINTVTSTKDIPRDGYVGGNIKINADNADGFEGLDTVGISIRGRGNSTWTWDKKPYKIKFNEKTSVLGLTAAKKWVLLANYSDKSLVRNTIAFSAAKFLDNMKWAPTQYVVDLFLNGEYVGVYSIGEQIESGDGRVELADNGTELDTGYLIEVGGTDTNDVWDVTCFMTDLIKYAKIKTPEEGELTKAQVEYIKNYVIKANDAVKSLDGYDEYIDVDSLIDWFILHELSYNLDSSFRRSCYITKDAGGKLTMGPAWDFDLAFGNFNRDKLDGKGWACLYAKDDYVWTNWITYLLSDQKFVDRLSARWEEVGDDLIEYLYSEIDRLYELISPSAKANFDKWKILNIKVGYQPSALKAYNTYEKQIDFLKEYISRRAKWMGENVSVVVPFDGE